MRCVSGGWEVGGGAQSRALNITLSDQKKALPYREKKVSPLKFPLHTFRKEPKYNAAVRKSNPAENIKARGKTVRPGLCDLDGAKTHS